jgi:hypothetical protein
MTKAAKTEPETNGPGVVLYGLDENGKPRAARFGHHQIDLAAKAASLMGLTVCPITPNLADISERLPAGRIYASGHGFVPNVRRDLYSKLVEVAETAAKGAAGNGGDKPTGQAADTTSAAPPLAQGYPRDWDDISVGHLVLAPDGAVGWWEAIVIARDGDVLTLRWRDYSNIPKFTQHRTGVALLKHQAA